MYADFVKKMLLIAAVLVTGCTGQAPVGNSQADSLQVIFEAGEVPWETLDNGWRRKVLFSGELTFVLLEAKGPTSGPIELHSHVHDQISYVMEGELEVQIGDETRNISTGGFYRVPVNVPHGVQVLSGKLTLVDAFTPPREDFRK
jgi:quercetin dioxygenase-like cupin family protein